MRILTLNIWGGHLHEELAAFVDAHRDIDIFCLQEVYHRAEQKCSTDDRWVNLNIFEELQQKLPGHHPYFKPVVADTYGIGMLVSPKIAKEGEVSIHENPNYSGKGPAHRRNLQWVECDGVTVVNIHGLWNGRGKGDSPERVAQAHRVRAFLDSLTTPYVLCGDFNLRPDTESYQIIASGLKDMIQLHGITSTRTSYYPKDERFADYILISPELSVKSFKVLDDEVSDHAPLLLELSSL